jgi:non-haem dioxygenase in morphine synthesis N-terminal
LFLVHVYTIAISEAGSRSVVNRQHKRPDYRINIMTNLDIETERSLLQSGFGAAPATRDNNYQVPVIDMSQTSDEELARQLWDAAHLVGFFTVINHGIPLELIDQAFEVSAQFFSQSQEEKEQQSPFAKDLNSGYEYFTQVRPSTGTADQKESLQVTARKGAMDGRWPSSPDNFKDMANQFLAQAHRLAGRILYLLEKDACPLNEPGQLGRSHTLWGHDGQCTLRLFTAQKLTGPDSTGKIHWHAGPHTDWYVVHCVVYTWISSRARYRRTVCTRFHHNYLCIYRLVCY